MVCNVARSKIYPSKIRCPTTANIVHRTRLFQRIDSARSEAKIIWIAAPGGSGKTTLVSSYLEKNNVLHCWYQVDEDDKDLATFFHYLGLAGKLAAPRRKKSVPKLTPEYQQGIPAFTRQFFLDLSSRLKNNGLIVLDDFQLWSEADPVPVLLPRIADALVDGVSVVVMSRNLPPPSMNALVVKRQLCVIDTKLMRFEEDEWMAASQLFNATQSREKLISLHRKLDGWIAGLVLLPRNLAIFERACSSGLCIDVLDTYVAEQFLSSLDSETVGLLMKVCYMPSITATSAMFVSGFSQSQKLLANLAQKNLFVLRQGDKGYTVHPLVKEYLKQRAENTFSDVQLRDLRYSSAQALQTEGEYEAAADLWLELGEWQALRDVVLTYAALLFDSGRIGSLEKYIGILADEFHYEPWVNYWKGKLAAYKSVVVALSCYEKAYAGFLEASDSKGLYLTWYSAVSVICSTLVGGEQLVAWIMRYEALSDQFPVPPQELERGAVEAILLHAYFFSGQVPEKREGLRRRLALSIDVMPDGPLRLHMMANYAIVAAASGVRARDIVIFNELEKRIASLKDDPVLYLGASIYFTIGLWAFNNYEKQLALQYRALEVAEKSGVSVFNGHIHAQIAIAALGLKKMDLAKEHINKLKMALSEREPVYESLYLTCIIIAGTCMDEYEDVDSIAEQYLRNLDGTHIAPFIIHHKLLYLYYLCVRKKTLTALSLHDNLLRYCEKQAYHGQTSRFYLIYAKIFSDSGDEARAKRYLSAGLNTARSDGVMTCCHWPPALMAWACQRALELEIETAYVVAFIEQHYEVLPEPGSRCQTWPRPYHITTFGRFEVRSRKNVGLLKVRAGRLIALLKTLVMALDNGLTSYAIKEKLYAGADYEKASQSLDTQIHRLRKLFDNEQVVCRWGDSIKLNLKYFWIDVLEFETLGKSTISAENALSVATRLQELYKGEYLPDDDSLDVIAQRERYRNMYLSTLFKCIDHLSDEPGFAVDLCQNALALEPLSEPLYRKLMSIYLKQGNRDMAEVTLNQCRAVIKRYLDANITDETSAILNITAAS